MCFEQPPFSLLFFRPPGSTYSMLQGCVYTQKIHREMVFVRQHWPEPVTATSGNPKIAVGGSKREREVVKSFEIPLKLICQAEMPPGRWSYCKTIWPGEKGDSESHRRLSSYPQWSLLKPEFVSQWGKQTLHLCLAFSLPLMCGRQGDKPS